MAVNSTTKSLSYEQRAQNPGHPLSAYLLRLMTLKKSNLCLSADVSSADTLLHLAATLGPSIVILKTHYDIITDWDSHPRKGTGAQLAALAKKHGFLIFEDRKYSDIGSTVQKQYIDGPGRVVEWAHITNAHILPGAAIVTALAEAAVKWRDQKKYAVRTNISTGTPRPGSQESDDDDAQTIVAPEIEKEMARKGSKGSIVSITTVSQHIEDDADIPHHDHDDEVEVFPGIEQPPLDRGLLLLAQMSSAGNFLNAEYTKACVGLARDNKGFVMGYIAQESLNTEQDDFFLSMTPGCQLPPPGEEGKAMGDGLGQQYNTPAKLVGEMGNDVIIVGRGIIKAADPVAEAERYRQAGWEAYEARLSA